MSKIIAVVSQKGGVGKTTTALNLGFCLSLAGEKVLILDVDPQGGVALACGLKKRTARGLVHVLRGDIEQAGDVVEFLRKDSLAVAGVGIEQPEDINFFENAAADGYLGELIENLAADFDYVLVDAPVGVGGIVKAVLEVSTSYLVVINCKAGTVKSLPRLIKLADWLKKKVNAKLELQGIVTTMFDESSLSEVKIYNYFKARLPTSYFYDTVIPWDARFEQASIKAIPVAMLSDGKEVGKPYMKLALEIQAGGEKYQAEKVMSSLGKIEMEGETDFHGGVLENILRNMCDNSQMHGAVIADEMGFPLANYKNPVATEALAAFTSVLDESLQKACSLLELESANNISMEINESDKLVLRKFDVLGSTYFLLVVCPLETEPFGEMALAVAKIRTILA